MTDPTYPEFEEEAERLTKMLCADYLARIKLNESIKKTETQLEWLKVQMVREMHRAFREQARATVANE